ncbi:hypothetical protein MMC25_002725 [Agyrium rufum]|nr:hypothetical protein [Agyrium rufum]
MLRPSQALRAGDQSSISRYTVIGECFLLNLTQGKAILGGLSEGYEHITTFVEAEDYFFDAYRHRPSGSIQLQIQGSVGLEVNEANVNQKLVLITGANQGIGYATAKNLVLGSASYRVIIGSRVLSKGEDAVAHLQGLSNINGTASAIQIDVTSDDSVDSAAKHIAKEFGRLDILVNNAGICSVINPPNRERYREILNTNVVGALSVTEAFLELLRKSSEPRLIFVSSSTGSISQAADPSSRYHAATAFEYRSSKAALNMLMVLYRNRLGEDMFKVHGADPGLCATNFTGDPHSLIDRAAATPA